MADDNSNINGPSFSAGTANVNIVFGIEGSDDVNRAMRDVRRSSEDTSKTVDRESKKVKRAFADLTRDLSDVSDGAEDNAKEFDNLADRSEILAKQVLGVTTQLSELAAVGFVAGQVLKTLGIGDSQVLLADYSKTLLASRATFAKYGKTVLDTRSMVESLSKEFQFTRQETYALAAAVEQGFNYAPPERFAEILSHVRDVVGENQEAMNKMISSIAAMGQQLPIYQEMFQYSFVGNSAQMSDNLAKSAKNAYDMGRGFLFAAAMSGQISVGDFKEQLGFIRQQEEIAQRSQDYTSYLQEQEQELQSNVRTLNVFKKTWEDIQLKVAEQLQPTLEWVAEILENNSDFITDMLSKIMSIGKALTAAFVTLKGMSLVAGTIGSINTIASAGSGILQPNFNPRANRGRGDLTDKASDLFSGGLFGQNEHRGIGSGLFDGSPAKPLHVWIQNPGFGGSPHSPSTSGRSGGTAIIGGQSRNSSSSSNSSPSSKRRRGRGYKSSAWKAAGSSVKPKLGSVANFAKSPIGLSILPAAGGMLLDFIGDYQRGAGNEGVGNALSTAGSALTYAGMGAMFGSILGPPGAAIGAGIGLVAGTLKGFKDSTERNLANIKNQIDEQTEINISNIRANLQDKIDSGGIVTAEEKSLADARVEFEKLRGELKKAKEELEAAWFFTSDEKERIEEVNKELSKAKSNVSMLEKEAAEANKRAEEQAQKWRMTDGQLVKLTARFQVINSLLQTQEELTSSQLSKMQAMASLSGAIMGGLDPGNLSTEVEASLASLTKQLRLQKVAFDQIKLAGQEVENAFAENGIEGSLSVIENLMNKMNQMPDIEQSIDINMDEFTNQMKELVKAGAPDQAAAMVISTLNQLQSKIYQTREEMTKVFETVDQSLAGTERYASSVTSLVEAQIDLASNLAVGVAPSAEMRMDAVRGVEAQITVAREALSRLLNEYEKQVAEIESLRKQGKDSEAESSEQNLLQLKSLMVNREQEITQLMSKQAQLTRSIRDGYVSAISAMTTGSGIFTQIMVDQNSNLGVMQAATDNQVVSMRSGAMARGLTSSERYTTNGIISSGRRFGASEEVNALMNNANPLAQFMGTAEDGTVTQEGAEFMKTWIPEISGIMNTAAASLQKQRYSIAEIGNHIKAIANGNPVTVILKGGTQQRNSGGPIVEGTSTSKNADSVHALLTPGEFISRREVVSRYGQDVFDKLNSGALDREKVREILLNSESKETLFSGNKNKNIIVKNAISNLVQSGMNDESLVDAYQIAHYKMAHSPSFNADFDNPKKHDAVSSMLSAVVSAEIKNIQDDSDKEYRVFDPNSGRMVTRYSGLTEGASLPKKDLFSDISDSMNKVEEFVSSMFSRLTPDQNQNNFRSFDIGPEFFNISVPDDLKKLYEFDGPRLNFDNASTRDERSDLSSWRLDMHDKADSFLANIKERLESSSDSRRRAMGSKFYSDMAFNLKAGIRSGMPIESQDNIVSDDMPIDSKNSLSEEEQFKVQTELERRKDIINKHIYDWRRKQGKSIVAQMQTVDDQLKRIELLSQLDAYDPALQKLQDSMIQFDDPTDFGIIVPGLKDLGIIPSSMSSDQLFNTDPGGDQGSAVSPTSQDKNANIDNYDKIIHNELRKLSRDQAIEADFSSSLVYEDWLKNLVSSKDDAKDYAGMQKSLYNMINDYIDTQIDINRKTARYPKMQNNLENDFNIAKMSNNSEKIKEILHIDSVQDLEQEVRNFDTENLTPLMTDMFNAYIYSARKLEEGSYDSSDPDVAGINSNSFKHKYHYLVSEAKRKGFDPSGINVKVGDYVPPDMPEYEPKSAIQRMTARDVVNTAIDFTPYGMSRMGNELISGDESRDHVGDIESVATSVLAQGALMSHRLLKNIPGLADGGIVNPTLGGSLVNIGEGGQREAVIPLPQWLQSSLQNISQAKEVSYSSGSDYMSSISDNVNAALGGQNSSSGKVEISLSSGDKKRIVDAFVQEMTATLTNAIRLAEDRVMDDLI